jgi:hypothetical protein
MSSISEQSAEDENDSDFWMITTPELTSNSSSQLQQEFEKLVSDSEDSYENMENLLTDNIIIGYDGETITTVSKLSQYFPPEFQVLQKYHLVPVCTITRIPFEENNHICHSLQWIWYNDKLTDFELTTQSWIHHIKTLSQIDYNAKMSYRGLIFSDEIFVSPRDASIYQGQMFTLWIKNKLDSLGVYWTVNYPFTDICIEQQLPIPSIVCYVVMTNDQYISIE